jgi:uncharacterized membrane protein
MRAEQRQRLIHRFFVLGVIVKGIDGAVEIAGGVALLLLGPGRLPSLVRLLTRHELAEDPHDLVGSYLLRVSQHLSASSTTFAAAYLLAHGLVKAGLVAGLLARRRRAYPAAILAFLLFVSYQLYRYSHTHSPALLALSVIDVCVIALTWAEYRRLRAAGTFS